MRTKPRVRYKESGYLLDRIWPVEAPSTVHVRLPYVLAGVTAPALGLNTTVARPAVATLALAVDLVQVVLELGDDGGRDGEPTLVHACLQDVVCDVGLSLTADIHDVQAKHWEKMSNLVRCARRECTPRETAPALDLGMDVYLQ